MTSWRPVLTSDWSVDRVTGDYRDGTTGQIIPASRVRQAVEQNVAGAKVVAGTLVRKLVSAPEKERQEALERFEAGMALLIGGVHLLASAVATASLVGIYEEAEADLEQTLAQERGYLSNWTKDVAAMPVAIILGGAIGSKIAQDALQAGVPGTSRAAMQQRAGSYMDAALMTYERQRALVMQYLDFAEARRVLRPGAEHCQGCEEQADKGWVPIDELVPLGREQCGQWCECDVEYRKFRVYGQ